MSDMFDHELDAYESQEQHCGYGVDRFRPQCAWMDLHESREMDYLIYSVEYYNTGKDYYSE